MKLTVWERGNLSAIIGMQKGTLQQVRVGLAVLDALELSVAEREAAGQFAGPQGMVGWEHPDAEADVALTEPQVEYLRAAAEAFTGWPVSARALALAEKLTT